MIRPTMEDIPQFSFPNGFSIRPMETDEVGLWVDVVRDAEEYGIMIDRNSFHDSFGSDLRATAWRCFFIVNSRGTAVGTISAWYCRNYQGQDYGRIHWLYIRPAYRRKGLAKAAMSYAMNRLAAWHERCWLSTATARIPAIRLYLDFGFVPNLNTPNAREAWSEVKRKLSHPALDTLKSF